MILVIALAVLILAAALCYAAVFCWVRARRLNRERSVVGPLYMSKLKNCCRRLNI